MIKKVHYKQGFMLAGLQALNKYGRNAFEKSLADVKHTLRFAIPEKMLVQASGMIVLWARNAWPLLELSHKLAASLAATSYSSSVIDDLLPPWNTFGVIIPAKSISNSEIFCLVSNIGAIEKPWGMLTLCDDPSRMELRWGTLSDLARPVHFEDEDTPKSFDRLAVASQRVIVGAMLESQNHHREIESRRSREARIKNGKPQAQSYVLGRPVIVDVRASMKEWIEGGGGSNPTVQSLVSGHYKMQPHGPGREQRKYIHVEPYWRGPEDAPIVVRPHKLGSTGNQ